MAQHHTSVPHLVGDLESRFSDLESRFHEAYWESQVRATPENEARRAEIELEDRILEEILLEKARALKIEFCWFCLTVRSLFGRGLVQRASAQ